MKATVFGLGIIIALNCLAQDMEIQLQMVPALAASQPYGVVPLLDKIALAPKATRPATSLEAAGVLRAALFTCHVLVPLQLPDPDSTAILTHDGEDVLVARWHGRQLPLGSPNIILWDDPKSTSLLFQLPARTFQIQSSVEALLRELIKPDWSHATLYLYLSRKHYYGREFLHGGMMRPFPSQYDRPPDFTLQGASGPSGTWLSINFSRFGGEASFEPEMKGVPERFPPLRARVPNWTTSQLMAETRRKLDYVEKTRGQILLNELLSRPDLTLDDFRDLVDRCVGSYCFKGGGPAVVEQVLRTEQRARFAPAILDYFHRNLAQHRLQIEFDAGRVMSILLHDERPEFCDMVADLLDNNLATDSSYKYIARFCPTREDLRHH